MYYDNILLEIWNKRKECLLPIKAKDNEEMSKHIDRILVQAVEENISKW